VFKNIGKAKEYALEIVARADVERNCTNEIVKMLL
jgi:hypothetical protein